MDQGSRREGPVSANHRAVDMDICHLPAPYINASWIRVTGSVYHTGSLTRFSGFNTVLYAVNSTFNGGRQQVRFHLSSAVYNFIRC